MESDNVQSQEFSYQDLIFSILEKLSKIYIYKQIQQADLQTDIFLMVNQIRQRNQLLPVGSDDINGVQQTCATLEDLIDIFNDKLEYIQNEAIETSDHQNVNFNDYLRNVQNHITTMIDIEESLNYKISQLEISQIKLKIKIQNITKTIEKVYNSIEQIQKSLASSHNFKYCQSQVEFQEDQYQYNVGGQQNKYDSNNYHGDEKYSKLQNFVDQYDNKRIVRKYRFNQNAQSPKICSLKNQSGEKYEKTARQNQKYRFDYQRNGGRLKKRDQTK